MSGRWQVVLCALLGVVALTSADPGMHHHEALEQDHAHAHEHDHAHHEEHAHVHDQKPTHAHSEEHDHADGHDSGAHVHAPQTGTAGNHAADHAHGQTDAHSHTDHAHAHEHEHSSHEHSAGAKKCASDGLGSQVTSAVAKQALVAIVGISCAPLFSVPLLPLLSSTDNLAVGMSFAAGSLIADVFLHVLPHEMMKKCAGAHHTHDHGSEGHSHNVADLWGEIKEGVLLITGFVLFMLLAKLTRAVLGPQEQHTGAHGHSHTAGVGSGAVVLMIADASHNFTDGLAVGAAFLVSPQRGMATAMAVFFHELPHEVGDIAVLINQGLSKWRAVFTQFMTAGGALLGCVLGLLSGSMMQDAGTTVGLLSAGGFIYVATVTVAPQLMQGGLWQTVKELVGFGAGVGMMVLVLVLE